MWVFRLLIAWVWLLGGVGDRGVLLFFWVLKDLSRVSDYQSFGWGCCGMGCLFEVLKSLNEALTSWSDDLRVIHFGPKKSGQASSLRGWTKIERPQREEIRHLFLLAFWVQVCLYRSPGEVRSWGNGIPKNRNCRTVWLWMRNEDYCVAAHKLVALQSLLFSASEAASGEAFAFEKNGEMVAKASCVRDGILDVQDVLLGLLLIWPGEKELDGSAF